MTTQAPQTAATGIAGLDDILCGGLPRDRLYLVKGRPGSGKTTLALQFLLEGKERGEEGLYITLSETPDELRAVAASHGWSLAGLSLFELPSDQTSLPEEPYTMYHPSEVELNEAVKALLAEVARVKPKRVVFDSLSEIRLLAEQPLRYRRQILAMKHHFAGSDCTVLLLDDHQAEHLDSLVHGVISLDRSSPDYGGVRRRLEVSKLRGVRFRDGFHDYTIEHGGLAVYPRLVATEHRTEYAGGSLASGVGELDQLLGGGLDRGTATLLVGPAGSGKSSLAAQYLVAAAKAGEHAAMYTFEESVNTLLGRSAALGMALRPHVDAGLLTLRQFDPAEISPGQFAHDVRVAVEQQKARVVVLDSLTGYLNAMPDERLLLNQLHELLMYLGQHGVITILIAAQHGVLGTEVASPIDVSYLADTVVLFRYFEAAGRVRNAISVMKKRSGLHERTIREYALGKGGITIGDPLVAFHGVLTGVPTYTGLADPLLGGGAGLLD